VKRIISFLLLLTLVSGLLPAGVLASEETGDTANKSYTYVFTNAAHTGSATATSVVSFSATAHSIDTTVASVSAPWGYVAQSFPHTVAAMGTEAANARLSYYRPDSKAANAVVFNPQSEDAASALCLEIDVANGGEFVPSLKYSKHSLGPVVELYVVPKGDTAPTNTTLSDYVKSLDEKYHIGTVNAYGSGSGTDNFSPRTLSAGRYYFIIVPNGESESAAAYATNNNKTFHYFLPASLTFDPRELQVTASLGSEAIEIGESTKITALSSMVDGGELPGEVTYSFASKNTGVAEVDNDGNVTAVSDGTAEIVVTASCGTLKASKTLSVKVSKPLPDAPSFTYDFNQIDGKTSNNLVLDPTNAGYDNTNGTWEYVKVSGTSVRTVDYYGIYISMYDTTDYVALKLNVPYAGKYNAKLVYYQDKKTGGVGDVFLIPASADISTTAAVDGNKEKINLLRDISYFNTEPDPVSKYDVESDTAALTIPEAGEYYLIFRSTGTHSGYYGQYPHKFILEGKDTSASAVMYATVTTSKKEVKPGETAEVIATGWMNNGEELTNDVVYTYEPSDSSVISIDEKGKITGLKDGRVSIKVTLSVGERALTYEVPFIVDSTEKTGYTVFYNLAEVSAANITSKPAFATMTPDRNDNFWGYLANSDSQATPNWAFSYTESGLRIGQNRWASFVINVPVEGVYTMYIEHGMHKEGCDVGVYVSDGTQTDSPIDDAYFVGSFNTLDANADNYKTLNANPSYIANVSLKKGINRVAFRAPKSSGNAFAIAGNIILDGGDKTLLMHADMEISDGGKVTVSGKMSDGSDADLSRAEIKYQSSNTEVVEVPAKGNALIIKAPGEATITAEISLNGEEPVTVTKKLTVTKLPEAFPGIDVEYNFYEKSGSWDPVNNPPEGFDAAKYPGDLRGITYQYTGVNGMGNWQYGMTGGNAAWTPKYGQVYMYEGAEDNPEKFLRLQLPKVGDWVAFDIKVPQKGRYVAEFLYSVQGTYATKSDIFILPKDETTDTWEEITEILKTATPIGTADYYDENVVTYKAETIELGEVQFEKAGEYRLIFKRRADSVFGYDFPKKLTLYGKNQMHYIDMYLDKNEIEFGDTAKINVTASRLDGSVLSPEDYVMSASSSDSTVVSVSNDGVVAGKGDGTATISVKIEDKAGNIVTGEFIVTAVDNTPIIGSSLNVKDVLYEEETADISWVLEKESKNSVVIPAGSITYYYSEPGVVSIDNMGVIRGEKAGTVEISASAIFRGEEMTAKATVEVVVDDRKTEPTYYTYEKREAIAENVRKYDWAKSQMKSACNQADKYLDKYMTIYAQLPGEGIPRSVRASLKDDPDAYTCRYCGTDLTAKYAGGLVSGFAVDVVNRPWQVQCMECKRLFPSNDFESFFELGRDQAGYFDVTRARQKHHEMLFHNGVECECEAPAEEFSDAWYEFYGYGNPEGYLYNELYSELRDKSKPESYNKDPRTGETIDGNRWGVDDGFGYKTGRMATETCEEIYTYIAVYNRELHAEMEDALLYLTRAYLFNGDEKYGRAGAILTDRLADLYPSYDLEGIGGIKYAHNDGNRGVGKIFGCISEANYTQRNALACDAFFPMIEDAEVLSFLHAEAVKRGLKNDKSTPEKIWDNWERGILDETYYAMQRRQINGNFGMKQNAIACAAIIRDREPLTSEMLKWLYATDTTPNDWHKAAGGDLMTQLIDVVDRDGNNNESNPYYNSIIIQNLYVAAEALSYYKGEGDYNLYDNPKFAELFVGLIPFFTTENKTLAIGDGGGTANVGGLEYITYYYDAFDKLKDTVYGPQIADYLYMRNGFTAEGLSYDIYKKNPESLEEEVLKYMSDTVQQGSRNLTGYGLAILRDGVKSKNSTAQTAVNTLRDNWIYYGGTHMSHKHRDTLTLSMDAYGIDVAPDIGEPEQKTYQPNRFQWVRTTISHNTVLVNEKEQPNYTVNGNPLHFEDAGAVKVMDIEAPGVYNETSQYRRTAVMIEASDDVSYTVDFFRVKGGTHHSYSFHSQAENANPLSGLDFTTKWDENGNYVTGAQVAKETGEYEMSFWNDKNEFVTESVTKQAGEYIGSYADISLEPGQDPNSPWTGFYDTVYPRGYSWFSKVRRDTELESGNFSVEFDVKDYRKASTSSDGVKLRMTQLNDFTPDEVVIAAGYVPYRAANLVMPRTLDYVLVNRESDGEELDTLYTTVFEPYKNTPYISSMTAVDISTDEMVNDDDVARAIKVVHASGRVDYVIYATNNGATYTVTDKDEDGKNVYEFSFRGAIGVLSRSADSADASVIYRYVIDGDIIGSETGEVASYTGTVAGFNRDLAFDNYIDVNLECEDESVLVGKFINIENDGVRNGSFEIDGAKKLSDKVVRLSIGTTSLIRGHKDKTDFDSGYIYDIAENQKFTIPMSYKEEGVPEVENPGNVSVSAGSTVTVDINAESPVHASNLEYIGTNLPRGASVNAETGVFTWKPDSSQVGNNHVTITVCDPDGRESAIHFTVTVYGSTTGDKNRNEETPSTGDSGGSSGGGGGGGEDTPTDKAEDTTNIDASDENGNDDAATQPDVGNGGSDVPQFTDLTNHAWAVDAINTLAEAGIIKGTSATSFSPSANITRADFALLLVRAFELESDNTQNFADVSASDYFAPELAIARNNGIISGIGDNKFAPRNTITRQDMMVIVYRALQKVNVGFGIYDEPQYEDFATVAEYAKPAVTALIGTGLVNGKNGLIAPTDYTTRAEVAVLIKRILDYTNKENVLK